VAKRFDPRAEFATTWSLEGWIQCEVNKRQAAAKPVLHCWPQSETWCLKRCARRLADWIKLVGGRDADRSLATPAIILASVATHDAIFTTTTSRGSLHLNQIVTSVTTVSSFMLLFEKPLVFAHLK